MLVEFLLVIVTIFLFLRFNKKNKRYPDGPWRLPIIGNVHQLGEFPQKTLLEMGKRYGPILSVKLGSIEAIVLNDYKTIKEAFHHPSIGGRMPIIPYYERTNGKIRGIALTEGRYYDEQRKFMINTFKDLGLGKSSTQDLIQEDIEELMQDIENTNGKPIELKSLFGPASLNALMVFLFGTKMDPKDPEFIENIKNIDGISPDKNSIKAASMIFHWLNRFRKFSGLEETLRDFKNLENFVRKFVNEHMENVRKGNKGHDYIYSYLDEMKKTNDETSSFYGKEGIENLVFVLFDTFVGGAETSKHTLEFACVSFATYNAAQEKVREEIQNVAGNRPPSLSDRPNMPYTEAFINEVMRFSTLIPLGVPRRVTEDVEFHGFKIPAGTSILSNTYAAHQDKSAWGDPENFRPERFIKNGNVFKHEAFLAFGSGKRTCTGEMFARNTIFIFLTHLIQNFKILPDPGNAEKPHLRFTNTFFTTRPDYNKVVFSKI